MLTLQSQCVTWRAPTMAGAVLAAARCSTRRHCRLLPMLPPATFSSGRCLATVAAPTEVPPRSPSQEWLSARPFEEIPGPKKLPIVGGLLNFLPKFGETAKKDSIEVVQAIRDYYGDIVKVDGFPGKPTVVMLFNADDIEKFMWVASDRRALADRTSPAFRPRLHCCCIPTALLVHLQLTSQTHDNPEILSVAPGSDTCCCCRSQAFRNEGQFPMRSSNDSTMYYRKHVRPDWFRGRYGLLGTQEEEWHDFRRKVNQAMLQPRSAKLYVGPIDQVAEDFVNRMVQLRDENQQMPDDFLNELCKWSLESVSLVALDSRLGCLEPNLPGDSEPQKMIDAVQVILDATFKLEFRLSPWKLISTPTWRRYVKALDFFYVTSMRHINAAMDRIKTKGKNCTGESSVLERLLLQNDDPGVACVMALDMMFAGVDTTSNAAAACLYYLSKNPEAQQRLFEEVYGQLPESQSQPLTASKLEECRYLRACFREAMRLKPIAPFNIRRCVVDNLVLSGYRIPKGVDLMMGHARLSLSEQYFPQADQFRPERWLKGPDGRSEAQDAHPFASMPFGFGPRMCIGRRFAELEVYTLVARIIRRFRVELHNDVTWRTVLIHQAASPLKFKVIDRDV
ncbi:probable cytochrome P450 12a5, mitochondrial [Schistocerca nitens]|uniref:probable cytochrome P450 12a5, mitochondrial n=1 Tax=Schistocerca nitens TaxID=7011 RepID=UPI0021195552|nr:probable cytochrome P450 12a5, mitochondrial [Schistocerca nitens]